MKQGKPSITFLVGMPAVGKSTFIKQMGYDRDPNTYIHSTDDIVEELVQNDPRFDTYDDVFASGMFFELVIPILMERFNAAIESNMDIVVDMVNESQYKRNLTLKDIDKDDYIVRAVVFGHEPWQSQSKEYIDSIVDAVNLRFQSTGKSVPEDVLRERMFPAYEVPTREEGFDQINFVDSLNPIMRQNSCQYHARGFH